MISLRKLMEKDAPLMLEWMHDEKVQAGFKKNMLDATLEDAIGFIRSAQDLELTKSGQSLHFAIVNEEDEYLGTISLKNVDVVNQTAEYAVATRRKAHGMGTAYTATRLLLHKAFEEYHLRRVYLSVYSNNESAIQLYEKCGFRFEGEFREHFVIGGEPVNWKWYGILQNEFQDGN